MKRFIAAFLMMLSASGAAFAADDPVLEALLSAAERSNPQIAAAAERTAAAEARLAQASAEMGPKASAAVGALWSADDFAKKVGAMGTDMLYTGVMRGGLGPILVTPYTNPFTGRNVTPDWLSQIAGAAGT